MATKEELEEFLGELKKYRAEKGDSELRERLIRRAAVLKRIIAPPGGTIVLLSLGRPFDAFDNAFSHSVNMWDVNKAIDAIVVKTNEAIGQLESGENIAATPRPPANKPKAFIAHGGETEALAKLVEFLEALGVAAVIAEKQASEGRNIDDQVNRSINIADCGIILATAGNVVDAGKGAQHPRLNVVDELARLRERMSHRVILLLEEGVELPTNVSAIVYEHFRADNMDRAFIKVARELQAFGIIRAVQPDPPSR